MRVAALILGVLAGLIVVTGANAASTQTLLKPEFVFTPKSFDSNDNAQIILAGSFTGYCVKMGRTRHQIDSKQKKIFIEQTVSMTKNCQDLDMYVPYTSVLNLGTLNPGIYEIFAAGSKGEFTRMAELPVGQASENPNTQTTDERLYAPVSSVDFKMKDLNGTALIELKGVFTNTCLEMGSVEVFNKGGDVYEVLPLIKKKSIQCQPSMTPFSKAVSIRNFSSSDSLIHVRSMNGQSLNKVVTVLDRTLRSF